MTNNQEEPARLSEAASEDKALLERASAPTLRDLRQAAGELLALCRPSSNTTFNGGEPGERAYATPRHL
ncbi:MAG TPA: hypothetical protein PLD20_25420 [Blastocatellia bacterium]|nr:hypothetical protein [Blastocatellia bacterium]HMV86207.1 hypothetical protein [Blastocatellia bacterium]HMX28170.1 hypothetical protein [Blastocatellia bacterium]HMZ21299.1 hypothetical protein [Blastocatellia bacterium]HNG29924.1 hypothetical protein [Blastocatellia bacterium]